MTWFGRYKKTPRVKAQKFQRGNLPLGSVNSGVDFAKKKTRTVYGIANCCGTHKYIARTFADSIAIF